MARIVLTDAFVTINGVNLSDHIASITISESTDVIETSAFSTSATKTRLGGLKDNSVTLEFHQDFAAANVEATINGTPTLIGTTTQIVVRPTSDAIGAANPSYTFSALCSEWTPLNGAVGELATVSVTWPISGAVAKAVA
jgi:hypothetical protein